VAGLGEPGASVLAGFEDDGLDELGEATAERGGQA